MATINASTDFPSLLDHAKRLDPKGGIAPIVELLQKKTPVMQDAVFKEGNLATGELVVSRTGLPSISWRKLNEGVAASKSRTDSFTEACGMLAGKSVVDRDVANLNGNAMAFRFSEDKSFLSAFANEIDSGFFYHSTNASPEKFQGMAPRLAATTGLAGSQIIKHDAAAAGADQTSIWIVGWGLDTVYGIYPKGSQVGLQSDDLGLIEQDDGSGTNKKFLAYATYWQQKLGFVVKDSRYLVRIANVDTSALVATDDTLVQSIIKGLEQMQDITNCKPVIYVNRTVSTYLRLQARSATKNSTLTVENIEGKPVMSFDGVPVRRTDSILNTESVIA